jgi:hypothetical protein
MLEVPDGVTWRSMMPVLRLLFGLPGSIALVQTFKQDVAEQTAIVTLSTAKRKQSRSKDSGG